jgi:hypothetical protein
VCAGKNARGKNNPNFGKKWTDEQRTAASLLKKQQFAKNDEYRHKVGASNRGVKFSEDRIKAMHQHRNADSYRRYPSAEVRKVIGQKSKEKWTDEYRVTHRQTMETLGYWVPLEDRDPYDIYYKDANWQSSMIKYFDDVAKKKLNEFGIFGKKNSRGWVRDHIVSRMIGYEFNLPAYIIRHPANLQFIPHSDNVSKGFSERRLTSEEKECLIHKLLEKIKNYNSDWIEQEVCLEYIRNKNENMDNL